jgi:hypothetical protein
MDFKGNETYPADIATTFAMFCDEDATRARYENAGHSEIEIIESGADGEDYVIVTSRVVTVDLPGFAKKVLSPTNTMVQTDRWTTETDGARTGTWQVEVKGAPVKIKGTMRLEASDEHTVHSVTGRLDVKVPLIGGKVAKWAGGDAKRELDAEFAFNRARLSG